MSLPAGQQRALNRIEKTLAGDDLGLGPLFAIFTRLAGHEPMPATERVTAPPWRRRRKRRRWRSVATVIGLAAITGALMLSQALPSRQPCRVTAAGVAHVQSAGTGRQPACPSGQAGQPRLRAR
jgi:hypothetical protein